MNIPVCLNRRDKMSCVLAWLLCWLGLPGLMMALTDWRLRLLDQKIRENEIEIRRQEGKLV